MLLKNVPRNQFREPPEERLGLGRQVRDAPDRCALRSPLEFYDCAVATPPSAGCDLCGEQRLQWPFPFGSPLFSTCIPARPNSRLPPGG